MKITKRALEALEVPEGKDRLLVWDSDLPCFGVQVGKKRTSYVIQYYQPDGPTKSRRYKFSNTTRMAPEEARKVAKRLLAKVDQGIDPAQERIDARRNPTLLAFWDAHARPAIERTVRASTMRHYNASWKYHIEPRLGKRHLVAIQRSDVARLHADLRDKPVAGNEAVVVLRRILRIAVDLGFAESNPAVDIGRHKTPSRERVLSAEELRRLVEALDAATALGANLDGVEALRFIVWTGVRKNEAARLEWDWIDSERHVIRYPQHACKGGARVQPVSGPAWEVLERQEARGLPGPWVFPNRKGAGPVNPDPAWRKVRRLSGMSDLRIHDLRHNAATWSAMLNQSSATIRALLGHADLATSQRYIHLAGDVAPIQMAAQQVADAMQEAIEGAGKVKRAANE